MRKRLRKKKRLREFAEYGFVLFVTPSHPLGSVQRDSFLDRFLQEAIERNDLLCGGGGGDTMEFFVTASRRRVSVTEEQRRSVAAWLASAGDVSAYDVGPPVDAWHGDF